MKEVLVTRPFKVTTVYDILANDQNINWKLYQIRVGDFKWYTVNACSIDSKVYIKPYEMIQNYEYEKLFGFKFGCLDYDKNRVVYVHNAKL